MQEEVHKGTYGLEAKAVVEEERRRWIRAVHRIQGMLKAGKNLRQQIFY